MTKITELLEKLGSDASLDANIETMLTSDQLAIEEKELLGNMSHLKDTQPAIKCIIIAPAEDDEQESPQEDDNEKDTENLLSAVVNG
ncbi:hypothetical protein DXX93_06960 [Thalassotalea euphylliae]|uniref:Uncharacterized protein n=1 Tax=Thalassotalea euphylliae TaxID=1655234 RepID=A0A3E0TQM9_9GAMM|nr:hypothetical protein [Thalassotalea euphylliae]REL26342.1 hypothetical protein DXX93_06960 [Thalassotalea euphylliae]